MIVITAIIYNFLSFLCDIWSTVENYFQKIIRAPWKNPLPPPKKNQKVQVRQGEGHYELDALIDNICTRNLRISLNQLDRSLGQHLRYR